MDWNFHLKVWSILLLFIAWCPQLSAQDLIIEWQSPMGTTLANSPAAGSIPEQGSMDWNGDGLNELVGLTTGPGPAVLKVIDGFTQQVIVQISQLENLPITKYRFWGFADMIDDSNKEIIFFPRNIYDTPVVVVQLNGFADYEVVTAFSHGNDSLPWASIMINWDADLYKELLFNSPTKGITIWGSGYTPGLRDPVSGVARGGVLDCNKLEVDWVSPPNVSWSSGNVDFAPAGRFDYNNDGIDEIALFANGVLSVINPLLQDSLFSIVIPANILAAHPGELPSVAGFFDFCGNAPKQILIGWAQAGNNTVPLHRLNDLGLFAPTSMLLDSFVYFPTSQALGALGADPDKFACRAIADPDDDGNLEIVMQHRTNRRIVTLGLLDSLFFQPPTTEDNMAVPPGPNGTTPDYELVLKWETEAGLRPYIDLQELYQKSELDFDDDGVTDIVAWQESEGDTLAIGCKVFSLAEQSLLWSFDFPAELVNDTLRRFLGFHDANADGEKEAFLGNRSVVTQDQTVHQPFGEGFRIFGVFDMDSDGFADVVGRTTDGRLQVWGAGEINSLAEIEATGFGWSVFPNPVSGSAVQIDLQIREAGEYGWRLLDMQGSKLRQGTLGTLGSGEHSVRISALQKLPAATYLLQLQGPAGQQSKRLLRL